MPALPLFRPRDVVRAFERLGWQVARQRGSHIVLTKPGAVVTLSVPDHPQVRPWDLANVNSQGRLDYGRVPGGRSLG
jgi:predicted RNA binding protein YcfA (HicA-like mRNA interferase family)